MNLASEPLHIDSTVEQIDVAVLDSTPPVTQGQLNLLGNNDSLSALLDLSKQQRNLLLLRPLFQLELNKLRVGSETTGDQGLFAGIDTHYLVLSALDFMMEGTTMNMGSTQSEVLGHLAAIAREIKPTLTSAQAGRVAEVVLDTLDC